MRVLVDTCVWSLALRRKPNAIPSADEKQMVTSLSEAIQKGSAAIIGPIRQEVLSGIKEPSQFEKLRNTLKAFPDEPLETSDFEEAARLFNLCRSAGVQGGPVDILLCAVAQRRQWAILTFDQGLNRCLEVLQ
jgi:predicted nucleic acid-binding protein